MRHPVNRRSQRGAILPIVMILLVVLLAAGVFAFVGLRSDTGAARNERLARQLFDCAEQGLQMGKQFFSQSAVRGNWDAYLKTDVCAVLPCAPFPAGQSGVAPPNYPTGAPFKNTVTVTTTPLFTLEYQVGIYNNPGDPLGPTANGDNQIVVYSRCTDPVSRQQRAVQVLLAVPIQQGGDYFGQAGMGFGNQGNANNTR